MALVKTGPGLFLPHWFANSNPATLTSIGPADATGEKIAYCGYFWHPDHATKSVSRVGFRFGTVTKAGGSALTVSLQNVDTTVSPMTPDETQDQTVAIANANASFASNTWIRTGTLSATRSLAPGDPIAIVVEYDGAGRLGSDSFNLSCCGGFTPAQHTNTTRLKSGAGPSWSTPSFVAPNVVLECDDGTFGTIAGSFVFSAITTLNVNTGSTPDEIAMEFDLDFPIGIDGVLFNAAPDTGQDNDFDVVVYNSAGTALVTKSYDQTFGNAVSAVRMGMMPFGSLLEFKAGELFRVAFKPTTADNVAFAYMDVNDANHWRLHGGGIAAGIQYAQRTDAGSWTTTATRRVFGGVQVGSVDNGGGVISITSPQLIVPMRAVSYGTL